MVSLPGAKVAPDLPRRFDQMLAHGGPDGSGLATYLRDGAPSAPETADVALIHRRLAIIDLDRRADSR